MLWWPFWSVFIHFGAIWCASYYVQPHDPSMTSISPFKCPSNPEKDNKSYSTQIQISLLYHAMVNILVHFGHLVHFMCNPMTPPWIVLTPKPFHVSMLSKKKWYKSLRTNCLIIIWWPFWSILVHFDLFWHILVHLMCNPMTTPWLVLTHIPFYMSRYRSY